MLPIYSVYELCWQGNDMLLGQECYLSTLYMNSADREMICCWGRNLPGLESPTFYEIETWNDLDINIKLHRVITSIWFYCHLNIFYCAENNKYSNMNIFTSERSFWLSRSSKSFAVQQSAKLKLLHLHWQKYYFRFR